MPIFEYHCVKCDKDFEVLVFGGQKVQCPDCNGKNVKKLLSSCRHKSGGDFSSPSGDEFSASKGSSPCSSCSATSCSTCSHS